MTKKHPISAMTEQESMPKGMLIIGATIVILIVGWFDGLIPWGIKYAECGRAPIIGTTFAAAFEYELPSDKDYGPKPLEHYFCTENEAHLNGLRHS